jgi:Ca2+-binding EF-hand superfamily protein
MIIMPLLAALQFFDKDNNGGLSVEEFRTANRELGNLLTDEEIMSFVEIVDVTQDGDIQVSSAITSTSMTILPLFSSLEQ